MKVNRLRQYTLSPSFSPGFPCTACGKPALSYRAFSVPRWWWLPRLLRINRRPKARPLATL